MAGGNGSDEGKTKDGRTRVSDAEILEALETGKDRLNAPALSTSDIADFLPISRQAVKRRLENLAEEGQIGVHQAGRNRFWWIAGEASRTGHFELDEVVDVGDLSDDKLVSLFSDQIDVAELPDELVMEIIDTHLSAEQISDELLVKSLRNNVEYTELPDELTSDIVGEVYGYDTSYWASQWRKGMYALGFSMMFSVALLILVGISPPENFLGLINQETMADILQLSAQIAAFGVLVTFFAGIIFVAIGISGRILTRTDDPRPWREFFRSILP